MPKTFCPECDAEFTIGKPRLGGSASCPECGTDLEIISVSPLEVDYPLDSFDDDWDDDEEEEDEDYY